MRNTSNIRRVSAAFFLLLFSFSITPKRFLHDLLAHHQDSPTKTEKTAQITASGFHCHAEDLVVVAPFIPEVQFSSAPVLTSEQFVFKTAFVSLVDTDLDRSDNRGPPAFTIS